MITIHNLAEWRRREFEEPKLIHPPIAADLAEYVKRTLEEAGHPATWDSDCEAHAVMDLIKDIFRIRRSKLTWICETCGELDQSQLMPFEVTAWKDFQQVYSRLDKAIEEVSINGAWSGKWGE